MENGLDIVRAVLPMAGLIVLMVVGRWCIRMFFRRFKHRPATLDRCKCGYTLEHLSVPRCPECGRVINFDATAEELGLTNAELERAQAARLRRRQSQGESNAPTEPG